MSGPLEGVRITMLVTNDVSRDARVRKEARSLGHAGAVVRMIGCGQQVDPGLADEPFSVELVEPARPAAQRSRIARVLHNVQETRSQDRRLERAAVQAAADIIHANDLDTLVAGARAARQLGARLVYDAHELSSEAVGINPLVRRARIRQENRWIQHADACMTVNDFIARELSDRYGVELPAVVYNGADSCRPGAEPAHDPVRILFQGQFFADRNLEELVGAMDRLRGKAVLTLQGWGGVEDTLRRMVAQKALEETVLFVPPVSPSEVVRSAAEHDLGIINHKPLSLNHVYSSPNKLFDYMAAGLAILASDLPVLRQVIEDTGCGVLHEQAGEDALAQVLLEIVSDAEGVSAMKVAAVEACERYCWDAQAEKLVALYERVAAGGAR